MISETTRVAMEETRSSRSALLHFYAWTDAPRVGDKALCGYVRGSNPDDSATDRCVVCEQLAQ